MAKRPKRSSKTNSREERNQFTQQKHSHFSATPDYEPERFTPKQRRVTLLPRNLTQERYVKALTNNEQYIVFAMGPAGCGKTLLATQYAIKALRDGDVEKIVITRPAVSVDEQHGFLPGSLIQKMEPWVLPILDVFKEYYHPREVQKMMEDGIIEISPLAYMRGRTFKNSIIIADEMQNSTISQTKMVLTRIGEGSRIIMTGDLNQHDRGFGDNGLKDFVGRFAAKRTSGITVIQFDQTEVERHPIIEQILDLYDDDGTSK